MKRSCKLERIFKKIHIGKDHKFAIATKAKLKANRKLEKIYTLLASTQNTCDLCFIKNSSDSSSLTTTTTNTKKKKKA